MDDKINKHNKLINILRKVSNFNYQIHKQDQYDKILLQFIWDFKLEIQNLINRKDYNIEDHYNVVIDNPKVLLENVQTYNFKVCEIKTLLKTIFNEYKIDLNDFEKKVTQKIR